MIKSNNFEINQRKYDKDQKLYYYGANGLKINLLCSQYQQILMVLRLHDDYLIKMIYQNTKLQQKSLLFSTQQKQNQTIFRIRPQYMLLGYIFKLQDFVKDATTLMKIEFYNCDVFQIVIINNPYEIVPTLSKKDQFYDLDEFQQKLQFNCVNMKELINFQDINTFNIYDNDKYMEEFQRQQSFIKKQNNEQNKQNKIESLLTTQILKQQKQEKQVIKQQKVQQVSNIKLPEIKNVDLTLVGYPIIYGQLSNDTNPIQSIRSLSPVRKVGQKEIKKQPLIDVKMQQLSLKHVSQISNYQQSLLSNTKQLKRDNIQGTIIFNQILKDKGIITTEQIDQMNSQQLQTIKDMILQGDVQLQNKNDCYKLDLIYDKLQDKYFSL